MLFSEFATRRVLPDGRPLARSFVDINMPISGAFPNETFIGVLPVNLVWARRPLLLLRRYVYGTRDVGQSWEALHATTLVKLGFRRGIANPCCFFQEIKDIAVVVHGDDFTDLGCRDELLWHEHGLREASEIKRKGRLGESKDCDTEVRVLNRTVRVDHEGLHYEADPRHVDMLSQALPVESAMSTPAVREDVVDYDALLVDLGGADNGTLLEPVNVDAIVHPVASIKSKKKGGVQRRHTRDSYSTCRDLPLCIWCTPVVLGDNVQDLLEAHVQILVGDGRPHQWHISWGDGTTTRTTCSSDILSRTARGDPQHYDQTLGSVGGGRRRTYA